MCTTLMCPLDISPQVVVRPISNNSPAFLTPTNRGRREASAGVLSVRFLTIAFHQSGTALNAAVQMVVGFRGSRNLFFVSYLSLFVAVENSDKFLTKASALRAVSRETRPHAKASSFSVS
jgi:hypothetical protein